MEQTFDKKEDNDISLGTKDSDVEESGNETWSEKNGENDENDLREDSVMDSSEEEEDEEEQRKVREGFIVDDEEETDDDVTRTRVHKRRKRLSDRDRNMDADELDEEDLDLVMENTGILMTRDVPKFKRLKRRKEKFKSKDLEDIFLDEEDESNVDGKNYVKHGKFADEFADFIEEDDLDDDLDNRMEIRREKPFRAEIYSESAGIDSDAHAEVFEIFGDGGDYAYALENEDSEQYERKDVSLHDVFEHSEIVERMLTDMDEIIRITDIPERIQVMRAPYYHLQFSDEDILKEYEWISKRLLFMRPDIDHILLKPFKKAVKNVIDFYNRDFFEPSFIWQNRKDYLLFSEKCDDERKANKIHTLLRQGDLWKILDLDIKFRALIEKRNSFFEIVKNLNLDDKLLKEYIDKVESLEEITDLHDYIYFRYSENLKDMNMSQGSTFKRPSNKYSFYAKIRKENFYNLVRAFGLPPEYIGKNLLENTKRYFPEDPDKWPEVLAEKYILNSKYSSASVALTAGREIVVDELLNDPQVRKAIRAIYYKKGYIDVNPTEKGVRKIDNDHPFYFFKYARHILIENVTRDPDLYLQMISAEDKDLVTVKVHLDGYDNLFSEMFELLISDNVSEIASAWNHQRKLILIDLFHKIEPIMEKTIKENLKSDCEDALAFFCRKKFLDKLDRTPYSLKSLDKGDVPRVLTVSNGRGDPTKDDTSCVFVDEDGKVLEHIRISDIHEENSKKELSDFINRRSPDVIGVSGFSVSVDFLRRSLKDIVDNINGKQNDNNDYIKVVYVNDEVSRLYQNSERANKEFPNLPSLGKYCVSLARYMQSPLMEYVAMGSDITSICFHPWQHLVKTAIVDIVNLVGIDINDVVKSPYKLNLLPYVCGLGPRKAQSLCKRISLVGGYISNRAELITKSIVTKNIFINCASFFKISYDHNSPDFSEILDSTRVHPEDYELARKMAADALELDEEDVEEYDSSGGIVAHLMNDDPDKLSDLILEEYAEQLEKAFQQLKRNTLETIRDELQNPYEELRKDYKDITDQEIFTMLTGETPESLRPGSVIPVTVKKIGNKNVTVKLNCGIDGNISSSQISDNYNVSPFQVLQYGHTVQAVVLSLNLQKFTAELSTKASSIKEAYRNQKSSSLNRKFDWDNIAEEKDKAKIALKKEVEQRVTRVIKHPLFRPFNAQQAEDYLAGMQRGDVVIRPSSSGPDHIAITWKISEGIYQHIDVLELDKENEFSVGRQLRVRGKEQNYSYSDLDELIVSHIKSIARKVDEMTTNEKFQKGTRAETEQWLNRYSEANPRRSCYAFCFNPKYPGFFDLCFKANLKSKVVSWAVKVVPNAFSLKGNLYGDMNTLCNGFKMMFAAQANNRTIANSLKFLVLKTYGRSRVLNENHEIINYIQQNGNDVSSSPSSDYNVCFNFQLTPRSKVKAMLAEFDEGKFEFFNDSKSNTFSLSDFKQSHGTRKHVLLIENPNTLCLDEDSSLRMSKNDNAYERIKKTLINESIMKNDKYDSNENYNIIKKVEKKDKDIFQKKNNNLSKALDTSSSLKSLKKSLSNSGKRCLFDNLKSKEGLELKEKLHLMQLTQKKDTCSKMQDGFFYDDILSDSDSSIEKCFSLKSKFLKKTSTEKVIEDMQKETERMERGMALAPEVKVDKKTSILDFLKKVGYNFNVEGESFLGQQNSKKENEVIQAASESNISFTGDNYSSQNDSFLDIPFREKAQFSQDFQIPNITTKFSKVIRACLISKQIKAIDHQNQKKLIFKIPVSEESSDSELEIESLDHNFKNFKDNSKSLLSFRKINVFYSDFVKFGLSSQKNRIRNRLFDHELLEKVADQVKSERIGREGELKQKGVIVVSEEKSKNVVQMGDLLEKAKLEVEGLRKKENEDYKNNDNNDSNDDNIWNEADTIQTDEENNEEIAYNVESYKEIVCNNDNENNTNLESSDNLDLENIRDVIKMDNDDQIGSLDLLNINETKEVHCTLNEVEDSIIKVKNCRNNTRRVIMEDEDECSTFGNFERLQDFTEDDTFNLSQFFSCTFPNKVVDNGFYLQNTISNERIRNNLLTVNDPLKKADMDINLETVSNMNNFDNSSHFSNIENFGKMEKEFGNTQLSMFDPPSPDIIVDNPPMPFRYFHSNIAKADFSAGLNLSSNVSVNENFKRKKHFNQRTFSNDDHNDVINNDEKVSDTVLNSRYNLEVNHDKHFIRKPEEFIEDQAQESDDEYAGLGGVSDDDDDLDDVREIEDIIDNTNLSQDVDTSEIAAYYMKKEMDNDAKIINDLLNDITTGNLRKRRGSMLFDLDDSEDEENIERRNKRAQIIRQKLLDNQNLFFMANNPKMKAFLSTIEDNQEKSQLSLDFIDDRNIKLQEDNIKDMMFSGTFLNMDNDTAENLFPKSRISCSDKHIDLKKEFSFLIEDENKEICREELIDNDNIEKRFDNSINVIDRTKNSHVSKGIPSVSSLIFNTKEKSRNLFLKKYLSQKKSSILNDNCQIEKKSLGELFKINSITFASNLASRAVNYNRQKSKVINSEVLNKKTVNEKRKSIVLKLFQANTVTV
ncbi:hypothetical protein PCANB_002347 [Pneumocystis canis]|nr:hypothetical protein PCANB_002347 [Pneumocystis canis]